MQARVIAIPASRTLSGFACERGCDDGIAIESLDSATALIVTTRNSQYRLVVLDGASHRVLVQGGARFPEPVPARLQGATASGSVVKVGWIGAGLHLELLVNSRWVRTSEVLSVAVQR